MSLNKITIYSFRRCPYAMRGRLALAHARIPYILREVHLKNKPDHMLKISPKGTVPVLFDDAGDLFLEESLDVVAWAIEQNTEKFYTGEQNLSFVTRLADEFIPNLNKYKYPDRYDLSDGSSFKEPLDRYLDDLEMEISGEYIYGGKISYTDIALFPLIRQMRIVDEDDFDNMKRSKVLAWFHNILGSSEFDFIMKKYDPWDENNPELVICDPVAKISS
jgi:glutathione S-transferase